MPLRDEYPHGLEPAGGVEEKPEGYEEEVDREAAEEIYQEEIAFQEAMEAIRSSYQAWTRECRIHTGAGRNEEQTYTAAVEAVRDEDLDPGPEVVERYCEEHQIASWDGFFVSALCNENSSDAFTLPDMGGVSYLGYRDMKDITVEGDVGGFVGGEMRGGAITVQGGAENAAGIRMQEGTLTVKGDTEGDVGLWMEGGTIELHGTGDIAVAEDGRVERANGVRRYTVPSDEPEGLVERVLDILEGM